MRLARRSFLAGLGSASVCGLGLSHDVSAAAQPLYVSCGADRDGDYLVAALTADGNLTFRQTLPARGHAVAVHPSRTQAVVFARRPGTFAAVLDMATGSVLHAIEASAGRHFYGHGAFSADGRWLFASENDYAAGRGVLGVYDAAAGYRRVDELPSHGVGPHDVRLMPDGKTLAVANGGVRTHPDHSRAKLNLATMAPNLAFVDAGSGALLGRVRPPADLHQLSIRHLDIDARGRVAVAMQYQGDRRHRVPLVGLVDGGDRLLLLHAPDPVERRMRHYTGSVAFDLTGEVIAVSSPRGSLVTFWTAGTGALLHQIDAVDASGVTATDVAGVFLIAGGDGAVCKVDARSGAMTPVVDARPSPRWDNHLCRAS